MTDRLTAALPARLRLLRPHRVTVWLAVDGVAEHGDNPGGRK